MARHRCFLAEPERTLFDQGVGAMGFIQNGARIELAVMTPGGLWCMDAPSKTGGHWTRHGKPPDVTATPSIHIIEEDAAGNPLRTLWHGWLREGWLEDA